MIVPTSHSFKSDRELLKQYDNVIKEQVESGIIEQVLENSASDESVYFLPHHGVKREDKTTTKVCVVFDGSAKHGTSNLSPKDKRPKLEYASSVWDTYTYKDKYMVERVQRKAARFSLRNYKPMKSVTDMLKHLGGIH